MAPGIGDEGPGHATLRQDRLTCDSGRAGDGLFALGRDFYGCDGCRGLGNGLGERGERLKVASERLQDVGHDLLQGGSAAHAPGKIRSIGREIALGLLEKRRRNGGSMVRNSNGLPGQ